MKTITVNRGVIVGVFIFFGIAIFFAGVFTIGNQQKAFAKTIEVKSIFNDISGLQQGNNVWLSGVKIGTVKKIGFYGNAQVEITMNLERNAQAHIRKNAKTKISSDGFIGNRIVVIYGGTEDAANIINGDYLQSEKTVSTDDMLTTLQENNKNLLVITDDIKTVSKKIREGNGTIGELINDPSLANKLLSTITHFNTSSQNVEKAIDKINDYVAGFNRKGVFANELVTDTTVFADLKNTIGELHETSLTISDFAENIKQASTSLNKPDNTIGALLNDKQVASDLKAILINLNKSSEKLDEDLKALQHNFLLRGYFKKQEKQKKKTDSLHQ